MGYHTWSHLLFAHWRVPPEALQPLIPQGLEVDTFDGDAWLGMVAFHMSNIRPAWFPAIPGISTFHETNIRTYVRTPSGESAVWFLSLDAASWPVVKVARWRWNLPYVFADMQLEKTDDTVRYVSRRRGAREPQAEVLMEVRLGEVIRPPTASPVEAARFAAGVSEPGQFLVDRYSLVAVDRHGQLLHGQVGHAPYPLRSAQITRLDETLTDALGISVNGRPPDHVMFSDGVDVDIYPLEPLATMTECAASRQIPAQNCGHGQSSWP